MVSTSEDASVETTKDSGKSRTIAALLAIIPIGLHKYYIGDYLKGALHTLTLGGFYLVSWYHCYKYFIMDDEEFHLRVMGEYEPETTATTTTSEDGSDTGESGYIRDISDSGLSHERHDFDADTVLGDDSKYLDDDEELKYVIEGNSVEIEGGVDKETTSSSIGTRMKTVITDERVLLIIPQKIKGTDTKTIMYDDVVGVDLASGYILRKLRIQTPARTYDIDIHHEEVAEEAIDYIRQKKQEAGGKSKEVSAPEPDPTEQLQNLRELHESGAISAEEFEEKKDSLMEKI